MRASLAVGGSIAAGLLLTSVRDTVIPTLAILLVLFIGIFSLVFLVLKAGRPAGEKPVYPCLYSGIGNVSSAYPVNSGYRSEHVHGIVQHVYGLLDSDNSSPVRQPSGGVWTSVPSQDAHGESGGVGDVVSLPHDGAAVSPQRRQPSSVARRRAFIHRSPR